MSNSKFHTSININEYDGEIILSGLGNIKRSISTTEISSSGSIVLSPDQRPVNASTPIDDEQTTNTPVIVKPAKSAKRRRDMNQNTEVNA